MLGLALVVGPELHAQTLGVACFDEDERGRRSSYIPLEIATPFSISLAEDEIVSLQDGTQTKIGARLEADLRIDPEAGEGYRIRGVLTCASAARGFEKLELDHAIRVGNGLHVRENGWRAAITIVGLPPLM
jgi:hypothetical protein